MHYTKATRVRQQPESNPSHHSITLRQTVEARLDTRENNAVCGWIYVQHSWQTWGCTAPGTCRTIGNYFDCEDILWTTCLPRAQCVGNQLKPRELCCSNTLYPLCATGLKASSDTEITGFACAESGYQGQVSVYDSPTTEIQTARATRGATDAESVTMTTAITTASDAESTNTGGTDVGSKTPTGPIVGGVIGGLALLAFVGFGIWFMHLKQKKAAPIPTQSPLSPPPMGIQPPMDENQYSPKIVVPGSPVTPGLSTGSPNYYHLPVEMPVESSR